MIFRDLLCDDIMCVVRLAGSNETYYLHFQGSRQGQYIKIQEYKYTNYYHRWHYESDKPLTEFIMTSIIIIIQYAVWRQVQSLVQNDSST